MKGEALLVAASAYADGELAPDDTDKFLEDLEVSPEARQFLADIERLRRTVRYESVQDVPDLVDGVVEALPDGSRPPRLLRVAAVFAAGFAAGALFIGFGVARDPGVSAATIPERIRSAQAAVTSLQADLRIEEHGWHPAIPMRSYRGEVRYEAPERVTVSLTDITEYPSAEWVPNHTVLVIDDETAWSQGPAACPTDALPSCTPTQPRLTAATGRAPFAAESPAPLDLVVPVASFDTSDQPVRIGEQTVNGVASIGLSVPAAQVRPILDGLLGAGNWRAVHPTDRVELWLSDEWLTPVAMRITAASGEDRALWAVRRGYDDRPGATILTVDWLDQRVNEPVGPFDPVPADVPLVDAGFVDGPVSGLDITELPDGMVLHRSGTDAVGMVSSWSNGRTWLEVAWSDRHDAERLFGDVGFPVRRLPVGDGVGYVNERGDAVAVHGEDVDLLVKGSVTTDELIAVAAETGVVGVDVPPQWREAGTATLADAATALPGLLAPDSGYGTPAVSAGDGVATLGYAGPGNIGFTVVETRGELAPPMAVDIRGVAVRGVAGRWSPELGRLEWEEDGLAVTIRSTTLSLDELLAVAESMR